MAGFGRNPEEVTQTVRSAIEAGAVGANIEDLHPRTDLRFTLPDQVRRIEAVRVAGEATGVPLVVNVRTVALGHAKGDPTARLKETIRRSLAHRDAEVDCAYPTWLIDLSDIAIVVQRLHCPVNLQIRKGLPPIARPEGLGIRRVSFGPAAIYSALALLKHVGEEIPTRGTFTALTERVIDYETINRLAVRRGRRSNP